MSGQLNPQTEVFLDNYKEPLTKVSGGYGFYGTVAFDKETKSLTQCHLCGYFFNQLGSHVVQVHGKTISQYKVEMGIPEHLSLRAPNAKRPQFEQWAKLTDEEKAQRLERMRAGIEKKPRQKFEQRKESLYRKNIKGRCPDQLLEKVAALSEELGRTPSKRDFIEKYGSGMYASVCQTFGSWSEAQRILQLQPVARGAKHTRGYTRELLVKMMLDFKTRYGREPMVSDLRKGLLPDQETFRKYFGSWSAAKEYVTVGVHDV